MEQRLFIAACIMYVFSWISKRFLLNKRLDTPFKFSLWHGSFLLLILSCAYFVINFVISSSSQIPFSANAFSFKKLLVWLFLVGSIIYGFFSAKKKTPEGQKALIKSDLDWSNTIYFAGFTASIVMFFFIQAFKIPSASMQNTLLIGDHLFVNKAAYGFRIPFTQVRFMEFNKIKKGDIIVFTFPAKTKDQENCGGYQYGRDYVKRVVGMPGDKIEVKNAVLYVNDQEIPSQGYEIYKDIIRFKEDRKLSQDVYQILWEDGKLEHEFGFVLRDDFGPVIVPQDSYFAMGDNRDDSCDSRFWGPVPRKNIKGTAWFIHWPLNRIRIIK
ncbi:MAG: signal peptidase I [Elusimicrobiaceae bacterium]|nr:signal peptidase I [Elusimicrobiaceae bacterium]